ncbi:GAF domain-containing protein [Phormidium tenue FACHB-886]|nr:GAF domain-containing protein [Phormidium tenue FACHB-886]
MTLHPRQAPSNRTSAEDSLSAANGSVNGSVNGTNSNESVTQDVIASTNGTNQPAPLVSNKAVFYPGVSASTKAEGSRLRWFYEQPIRRKQLIALIASEVISIVGLVGVGTWLIIRSGHAQLVNQSQTELAVTDLAYNTKLNQIGSSFREQVGNSAVVQAARDSAAGRSLSADTRSRLQDLLANEVAARDIEYATLVGTDLRIIANANKNRAGDRFDPEGLVGTVLANPRQVKTSAIVTWSELEKEAPSLPEGFNEQDSLIRYVVTPVKDPDSGATIGALVAGDVVNSKTPIVEGALQTFKNGYSAVYQREATGNFSLSSSLYLQDEADLEQAESGVRLPNTDLLQAAVSAEGEVVSDRVEINGETYTLSMQALNDFKGQPVAILARGTSEAALNQTLRDSLLLQLVIAAIAIILDVWLAVILGRSIVSPIQTLRRATQKFTEGDRQARAEVFARDEVGELAIAFNDLADTMVASESMLQEQSRRQELVTSRAKMLTDVTLQIRQSLDAKKILSTSVEGVRALLQVDRVLIYRFAPDYKSGEITAESVGEGWVKALGQTIHDPLLPGSVERFRSGKISKIEDLATANLSRCHCEILERLEVQANLVSPIITGDTLIGLLCAHQCSGPRVWEQEDIDLMQQLTTQVGYALTQAKLLQQQQAIAYQEQEANRIISQMRRSLKREDIYSTVVNNLRESLKTDRVALYLFNEKWEGTFVAESVDSRYPTALYSTIADPCFAEKFIEPYRLGRVKAINDIYEAELTPCHIGQLEPLKVKANLIAPILAQKELAGLLIAHQCDAPRVWQEGEINLIREVASQLGFSLDQADLFAEREEARLAAEALSEEQRQQRESLQIQLINLLTDVEGATRGDLTVRADVTAGEIGTVADFFNSIVESLRQIVAKVKESAERVNVSLGENEGAIHHLADEALRQAEETTRTLNSVEQMTRSMQVVADSAHQAAQVARNASQTAEAGGTAMDLTVRNILALRETVGETAKKVKRLGESSQQISKVVSLINQIAMQTNLLAINAGIEAARAGEEGQGFAVVAEEVGELAARSAAATQEIEKIVDTIQRETTQVVEAMEQSTAQVVEGTQLVEDAKDSLGQILEVSRQIDDLVQSISSATVSQVETSGVVAQLMKQIAAISEETSNSSRQVSRALRQTVEVAQELQASVDEFEVGNL